MLPILKHEQEVFIQIIIKIGNLLCLLDQIGFDVKMAIADYLNSTKPYFRIVISQKLLYSYLLHGFLTEIGKKVLASSKKRTQVKQYFIEIICFSINLFDPRLKNLIPSLLTNALLRSDLFSLRFSTSFLMVLNFEDIMARVDDFLERVDS